MNVSLTKNQIEDLGYWLSITVQQFEKELPAHYKRRPEAVKTSQQKFARTEVRKIDKLVEALYYARTKQ